LFSVRAKIVIITVLTVILAVSASVMVSGYVFAREYAGAIDSMVIAVARGLNTPLDRILDLGIQLDDLMGFEVQCREAVERHPDIAYAMVTDTSGRILFHSDASQAGGRIDVPPPVPGSALSPAVVQCVRGGHLYAEGVVPITAPRGSEVLGAIRVGVPHQLIDQKRRGLLVQTASAGLTVLIVAAAVVLLAATAWVTRPLGRLLAVIDDIRRRDSDLSRRVPISSGDEIGLLSAAFNDMLADLQASQGEIRRHAENLEHKVAERTYELSRAKDAAEAAAQTRSAFLANMSHELRTPMTAILGFADSLLEPDFPQSDRAYAIQTIRRNGDHLLRILNDILDLSKLEAGRLEVEPVRCSPLQLAGDVQSLMDVRAEAKGLALRIECRGPVPATIQTDPTRVRQILLNLVGNAIKFTGAGSVVIVVQLVEAGLDGAEPGNGPLLRFDIIDTGCGMRPDQVARLFRPFVQGDASTTRRFGGTGLGLAISRRLARMLGGDVRIVRTAPGEGMHIRLEIAAGPLEGVAMLTVGDGDLRRLGAEAVPQEAPKVSPEVLSGRRVLLVEDGPDNQRLIGHIMRKAGADVVIVSNGREGVDAALEAERAGAPFDLLLMDIQMPVMDGYEAMRTLRAADYTRPIIALTAHVMASDHAHCREAGADAIATKPIDRRQLIALAQQCCCTCAAT